MPLTNSQRDQIEKIIKDSLRKKLENYNHRSAVMPFHTRLLGKDRLALYSFIHSLNTNFGQSIFEPVAIALASNKFHIVERHKKIKNAKISTKAQGVIQNIMDDLALRPSSSNKRAEIERIRSVCQDGEG